MNTNAKIWSETLEVEGRIIGKDSCTYFIADIAANHDSELNRAKDLIWLAKESGADAAKFQHFAADSIVSDKGFKDLNEICSHQSDWKTSVYDVYAKASVDLAWTEELQAECKKAGISFFTSPYSREIVDAIDTYVPAYKIGSGDITWLEIIKHIAAKGKPYFLATGASSMEDVRKAVNQGLEINPRLGLLQCNTNYTGSLENFKYINLRVLETFGNEFPGMVLGLSDHTPGHACVLGAIALGARIIEKHFTDDRNRTGPDHGFSMMPNEWKEMVDYSRELEYALGGYEKCVEQNEVETVVLQRRSLRSTKDLRAGDLIDGGSFIPLRPCPTDAISAESTESILGKRLKRDISIGDYLKSEDLFDDG